MNSLDDKFNENAQIITEKGVIIKEIWKYCEKTYFTNSLCNNAKNVNLKTIYKKLHSFTV